MLIFSPPFLSAALAFVLRGFKNRSSYTTAMILTIVLVVRQQIQRKVASSIDGVSLGLSAFILLTMITFVIYKKRVEMKPLLKHKAAADTETGNLVVVVNNDELPNDKDREYDDDDEGDSETTMAKNKPGLH
jgi:hypothetical protein